MKIKSIKKIIYDKPKQFYDVIEAQPFHNFLIKTNTGYICSHNCNFGVGNDVEKKKSKQKKMIAQIDARMESRFLKGTFLPTLNIVVSSKDIEQAFLQSYINTKQTNNSKTTLIVDEPQWVIRTDKGTPNDPGSFYVAIGNKFLAHELLPVNASQELVDSYRNKGYTMLKIPPGFRENFETNLEQSLMDIAGISISNTTKYISGARLNQAKVDTYHNPFIKDIIEVGNSPDDHLQYANFFDLSAISPEDKARPLFIHLDMSVSGDKTGIAGVWITGKQKSIPQQQNALMQTQDDQESIINVDNANTQANDLHYKLAFSVSIKAPKGFQISFEKNRTFIRWLREQGFAIKAVTADSFQSASIIQNLKSDGFNTEIISVDRIDAQSRICLPYQYLKSTIYERHVEIYQKCDLLTDELIGLERMPSGKIDHTTEGINSKDQSDSFCGALWAASKFADEYSYNYGDNLIASLDTSSEANDNHKKQQMVIDFQDELTKIYTEQQQVLQKENKQQQADYQQAKDIADGIIVIG